MKKPFNGMTFSATLAVYLLSFASPSFAAAKHKTPSDPTSITKTLPTPKVVLKSSEPTTIPLSTSKSGKEYPETFPFLETNKPGGVIYSLTQGIRLSDFNGNVLNPPQSCFTNKQGPITFEGNSFPFTFDNNMGPTPGLAVYDQSTGSSGVTFSGFSTLTFTGNVLTSVVPTGSHLPTSVDPSGLIYSEGITFTGGNGSITFKDNVSLGSGGTLFAKNSLNITNNVGLINFENNSSVGIESANPTYPITLPSQTEAGHGGAIALGVVNGTSATQATFGSISSNAGLRFFQNTAAGNGGAIFADRGSNFDVRGNSDTILFEENRAKNGGALFSSGNVIFSGNTGPIIFRGNTASPKEEDQGDGGAICFKWNDVNISSTTYKLASFSDNKDIIFDSNVATGNGGAISSVSAPGVIFARNGNVSFFNNTSGNMGGAISLRKQDASGSGKQTQTTLTLSADSGNILFSGNTSKNSTNSTYIRNAITADGITVCSFKAKESFSISFFDPVIIEGNFTSNNNANGASGSTYNVEFNESDYNGTILFSGRDLHPHEMGEENRKSTINRKVSLKAGTLILEKGAILEAYEFEQKQGSHLIMDTTSKLIIKNPNFNTGSTGSNGNIRLTDLAINLDNYDHAKQTKVVIETQNSQNTPGTITLPNTVTLIDPKGVLYENHCLSSTCDLNVLELKVASGTVTVTGTGEAPEQTTYGYQGTWNLSWIPGGAGGDTQTLQASWTFNKYIPGPDRYPYLVPASLWGSYLDSKGLRRTVASSSSIGRFDSVEMGYGQRTWLSGLGVFFHQDILQQNETGANAPSTATKDPLEGRGFRHLTGGYAAGLSIRAADGSVITLGWGQVTGKEKDYFISDNRAFSNMGALNWQKRIFISSRSNPVLSATASFGSSDNRMITHAKYGILRGSWHNTTYGGSAEIKDFVVLSGGYLLFSPFLRVDGAHVRGCSITENGKEGRKMAPSSLSNVSISPGLSIMRRIFPEERDDYENEDYSEFDISMSYIADAYRRNPSCVTTLLANNCTWNTKVANPSKHGFCVQVDSKTRMSSHFHTMINYTFELRNSSRLHNVYAGGKLSF